MVSILHKELESKLGTLKHKKLEDMQSGIKNKSELQTIPDQCTRSLTFVIDNTVYHLLVKNNKGEGRGGGGGLLTFFP